MNYPTFDLQILIYCNIRISLCFYLNKWVHPNWQKILRNNKSFSFPLSIVSILCLYLTIPTVTRCEQIFVILKSFLLFLLSEFVVILLKIMSASNCRNAFRDKQSFSFPPFVCLFLYCVYIITNRLWQDPDKIREILNFFKNSLININLPSNITLLLGKL